MTMIPPHILLNNVILASAAAQHHTNSPCTSDLVCAIQYGVGAIGLLILFGLLLTMFILLVPILYYETTSKICRVVNKFTPKKPPVEPILDEDTANFYKQLESPSQKYMESKAEILKGKLE